MDDFSNSKQSLMNNISNKIYKYQEAPLQLLGFKKKEIQLNKEALDMIRSIEDEIIIVSLVGKARTGKSFLLNLLLENVGKNQGVIKII